MYIAVTTHKRKPRFLLRESCTINNRLTFRDLADLGHNPGTLVRYPGGNAFYLDRKLADQLAASGADVDDDRLEDLFWPWIRPDIRRAVETFRGRARVRYKKLTKTEKEKISAAVHPFDKRRTHYLKFAAMDQGPVENMPAALFKRLPGCCRDEIEQGFIRQEAVLKPHEFKSYVYTVFDLQSFFQGFLAKKMPHVLNQQEVDDHFVASLCRLNRQLFRRHTALHHYLIRYAVMFFDYQYANTRLLDEMARDFMFRHHTHPQAREKSVPVRVACTIFNISKTVLKTLSKRELTRMYRKLAAKAHPDKGGTSEQFVELNNAYTTLLKKISPHNRFHGNK